MLQHSRASAAKRGQARGKNYKILPPSSLVFSLVEFRVAALTRKIEFFNYHRLRCHTGVAYKGENRLSFARDENIFGTGGEFIERGLRTTPLFASTLNLG